MREVPLAPPRFQRHLSEEPSVSELINLAAVHDGFAFSALHAKAQGEVKRGAVIVIQEIFGLDKYVHEDVARWSALGFEVLAPSMFDRQEQGFTAEHNAEGIAKGRDYAMANGPENAMGDIAACVAALKASGPVFLTGYCYGGTMAWLAASRVPGLAAVASYYGGGVAGLAHLPLACPVIVHLGRKDAHIPADEVKSAILAARPQTPVHIYEKSGHGFNNDGVEAQDPDEAALARQRTLDFFLQAVA